MWTEIWILTFSFLCADINGASISTSPDEFAVRSYNYWHKIPRPVIKYKTNAPISSTPDSYTATVSYGPNSPSLVYTCTLTSLLPPTGRNQQIISPNGYTCTVVLGNPGVVQEITETTATVSPTLADGSYGSGIIDPGRNVIQKPYFIKV